jgi:hypothetical protein
MTNEEDVHLTSVGRNERWRCRYCQPLFPPSTPKRLVGRRLLLRRRCLTINPWAASLSKHLAYQNAASDEPVTESCMNGFSHKTLCHLVRVLRRSGHVRNREVLGTRCPRCTWSRLLEHPLTHFAHLTASEYPTCLLRFVVRR